MRTAASLVALCLAACAPSQGDQAEDRYEMVKRNSLDPMDVCRAAREVEQAWLQDGDESKYSLWTIRADNDCYDAANGRMPE